MKPSEINTILAEKCMGWKEGEWKTEWLNEQGRFKYWCRDWNPWGNIADAFRCVDVLRWKGLNFSLVEYGSRPNVESYKEVYFDAAGYEGRAPRTQAICIAVCKVLGIEEVECEV